MIKISLIGNGFDLAHGAPTKYSEFMNYIHKSTGYMHKEGGLNIPMVGGIGSRRHFIHYTMDEATPDPWLGVYYDKSREDYFLGVNPDKEKYSIYFKSLLEDYSKHGNWSDLESHYYNLLLINHISPDNILVLNEEFEHLKSLFKHYLINEVENIIGEGKKIEPSRNTSIYTALLEDKSYEKHFFVTFNYTKILLNKYCEWLQEDVGKTNYITGPPIHIHGDLGSPDQPIIFGYGDDNSEDFEKLKQYGDDNLLINFKTYQYLQNNNYKNIFEILDSNKEIIIQIIGLSCGLGDKTLLQSIFEHPNVVSIEFLYHGLDTNYRKNLFNLSRIFQKSFEMRRKVVSLQDTRKI